MHRFRDIILLCVMVFVIGIARAEEGIYGESQSQNYITTAILTNPTDDFGCIDTTTGRITTVYFDGFGRQVQTVHRGASTIGGSDIIEHIEYNNRGLPFREWLPVAGFKGGGYTPLTEMPVNYRDSETGNGVTDFVYTQYSGEPTPKVMEVRQPGDSWHGNPGVRYEYFTNESSGELSCVNWKIMSDGKLKRCGNYDSGELRINKIIDEDDCVMLTFVPIV